MAVRQDGMVQLTWRQDLALNQPKVLVDVRVTRMCNEGRMSFRVDRGFVDPWVQGGDIDVMDLLTGGPLDGTVSPHWYVLHRKRRVDSGVLCFEGLLQTYGCQGRCL